MKCKIDIQTPSSTPPESQQAADSTLKTKPVIGFPRNPRLRLNHLPHAFREH